MQWKYKILLFTALLTIPFYADAERTEPNVIGVVMEHIGDSYEWHITTVGGRELTVPLPVIVRSPTTGWHCFSSARLRHDTGYRELRITDELADITPND